MNLDSCSPSVAVAVAFFMRTHLYLILQVAVLEDVIKNMKVRIFIHLTVHVSYCKKNQTTRLFWFSSRHSEFSVVSYIFLDRKCVFGKVTRKKEKLLQESSTSKWDDVVFIPPGFDVATDPTNENSK